MIKIGILGASGYTGAECVRLLQFHPEVEITHLFANKHAGNSTIPFFGSAKLPQTFNRFEPHFLINIDCLFMAVPHTTAHELMADIVTYPVKVIDLSADFRLSSVEIYENYYGCKHSSSEILGNFIYGCPEWYKKDICSTNYVANPGCYAIASILALKPLTEKKLIQHVTIDAKSGVSGAGKALKEGLLYGEVNEHLSAYNTNNHRHMAEVYDQCGDISLMFSPHLVPMSRGILVSAYVQLSHPISEQELIGLYKASYASEPFIRLNDMSKAPSTKYVVGSNNCEIWVQWVSETQCIIFSAIDNLIKGAAGNAIQNMNVLHKFDETCGLPRIAQQV